MGKSLQYNGKKIKSELIYDKKYLKAEKISHNAKINTKKGSQCIYISVILIASVYKKDKNYYPQVFLEKYEYVVRKQKDVKFYY